MKGLGAGGRLWELLERKPELPFNGGSGRVCPFALGFSRCGFGQLGQLPALRGKDGHDKDVIPASGRERVVRGVGGESGRTAAGRPRDAPESVGLTTCLPPTVHFPAGDWSPQTARWQPRGAQRKGPGQSTRFVPLVTLMFVWGTEGKEEASRI